MRESNIQRLPVELYRRIFLHFTVADILRAAHVCRHWRLLALDNPAYWADIRVSSLAADALDLTEHRLFHGRARAIRFTISHTTATQNPDDPAFKRLLSMLKSALPRACYLCITIDTIYRLHVEEALSGEAPVLHTFFLKYSAELVPDLPVRLPLGYYHKLFSGLTGKLRTVRLWDIVLPANPTPAFHEVQEVWWMNAPGTRQEKFPSYLFEFFPKCKRLRMKGGSVWFTNAPLSAEVVEKFRSLRWVDLEFPHASLPAFFAHLPLDDIDDLAICSPDEEHLYRALDPLRSQFHLDFSHDISGEFCLSLKGYNDKRVRRFAEPLKYYYPGSTDVLALFDNDDFPRLVGTLSIHITLWSRLKPWLPPKYPTADKLILILNMDTPLTVALPQESISFPALCTLVLQAGHDIAYVDGGDLIEFAGRLTTDAVALELRRVVVTGQRDRLSQSGRFLSVESHSTKADICLPI